MKCPHCNYEHGWSGDLLENVKGDLGNFFELEKGFSMVQKVFGNTTFTEKHKTVYGCPNCSKLFMD